MSAHPLLIVMALHMAWLVLLYAALTLVRAPAVWNIGRRADGSNPWSTYEPRISANLRNQFEWPIFFHIVCLLLMLDPTAMRGSHVVLAWLFLGGRMLHTAVQVLTANVRLRGVVFTLNFVAVVVMWVLLLV